MEGLRAGLPAGPGRRPAPTVPGMVLACVAVLVVAVVGLGGLVWWRTGAGVTGPSGDVAASLPRASSAPTTATGRGADAGSTGTTGIGGSGGADLVLQAAGAVARPGVYELPTGARVGDLVARAGGFTADADVDRVNLAAPLADGVRVWVPRRGEAEPPPLIDTGGSGGTGGSGSAASGPAALVDLNRATSDELDALPGVGPATAAAIIDHRQRNGPFRSVDELADVRGIGEAKLAQLRDLVRV
jgi:competence protein ComEA